MLAYDVPGEGFPDLDEANVQEFLDCYPGELAEEDTEQLTALS
jgi:hypothetical protein